MSDDGGAGGGNPAGDERCFSAEEFKAALGRFASGVVVLTVLDVQDEELGTRDDLGMTATAFTSVSVEPPLVLVGIAAESYLAEVMQRQNRWAVTLLAHGQKYIAGRFAMPGRPSGRVLLGGVSHHRGPHTGAIIPDGGLAALECHTHQLVPAGDHTLAVGETLAVDYLAGEDAAGDRAGLVRFAGRYHRIDP